MYQLIGQGSGDPLCQGACVDGKGDACSRRTKYVEASIVLDTDKVDGVV